MSDRDKLIELITKSHSEWLRKEYDHETNKNVAEYLADDLLANGVILPPCKVGNVVYCTVNGFNTPMEGRVRSITIYDTFSMFEIAVNGYYAQRRSNRDFGKTVFLTKEDAEEKLKELGK